MKKLITLLAFTIMTAANATEIKIMEEIASPYRTYLSSEFKINKELGRAWVSISADSGDVDSSPDTYRARVEGLSYDVASKTIVIENEGQLVECAKPS